jgi:hypothetical protein
MERPYREMRTHASRIAGALSAFRKVQYAYDLSNALLLMAQVRRAELVQVSPGSRGGEESALDYCDEALRLAARCGYALKHCDALCLRAKLRREAGGTEPALVDALRARDIADKCRYFWGYRAALREIHSAYSAKGSISDARQWSKAIQDLDESLSEWIREAIGIEHAHDREMHYFYGEQSSEQ